jgi:ankyrin repeat protein
MPIPQSAADLPPAALDLATKLFNYAREGANDGLRQYLDAGIPPNLTNQSGDTLLMLAAYHNQPETVKILLSKGADPNQLNDRGQSPIAGAVFKGYDDVVKILFEEGKADVRGGQPNAVETAAMFRRTGMLEMFGVAPGSVEVPGQVPNAREIGEGYLHRREEHGGAPGGAFGET